MRKTLSALLLAAAVALPLAACQDNQEAKAPAPVEISAASTGYYCGMNLTDHAGPKGQIWLKSRKEPVWFSSVRDTFAFTMLPEEPKDITAIYVNDMGKARDWSQPEPGTWIEARQAWFVIGSSHTGGMGGGEAVPFASEAAARAFAAGKGGSVVRFADMPRAAIFDTPEAPAHHDDTPHSHS